MDALAHRRADDRRDAGAVALMLALAIWIVPAALVLMVLVFVRRQASMPVTLSIITVLFVIPLGALAVGIQPSPLQLALYLLVAFTSLGVFFRIRRGW
jgi:hypothetical protein